MTLLDGEYHLITVQGGINIYIVQEKLSTPLSSSYCIQSRSHPFYNHFKAKQSKVLYNYTEEVISSRIREYYTLDDIELATPQNKHHSNSSIFTSTGAKFIYEYN